MSPSHSFFFFFVGGEPQIRLLQHGQRTHTKRKHCVRRVKGTSTGGWWEGLSVGFY